MLRKTRSVVVLTAVALVSAIVPGGGSIAEAASTCQVKSLGTHSELGQLVLISGTYRGPSDAVDVRLTCGIVRDGVTVVRVTDRTVGPVAALAEVTTVPSGLVTSCYEVRIAHLGGALTYHDACP